MSLNGSGTYSAPAADFPAVANTLIESTKFNNIINDIATALSTAVYKDGQQTVTANIPMGGFRFTGLGAGSANGHSLRYEQLFTTSAVTLLGALDMVKGADIASAGTLNLTTATGNGVHVTGTTTITAVTLGSGMWRLVVFDGALTLTHHATNNNLPGGANITTAAGDRALYWADGTTVYCAVYVKANGQPIDGIARTLIDAKGDIVTATAADTPARLAAGTNYTFLRALSSESTGLAWLGAFPSENISTGGTLTTAQMNKALISSTDSATYTLPDLTAALDGSVVVLASNGGLTNGITLAADASDSILDPTTGTIGSIVLVGTGESVAVVGCFANNRWYALALNRTAQRAILQFNSGNNSIIAGSTAYFGNSTSTTTEVAHDCRVPFKCIVSNLHTTAQTAQTGGQTTVYTVRKNAADTVVTCTNSSGRTASDTTNSVSFAQGDLISIKAVTSASATVTTHTATIELRRVT